MVGLLAAAGMVGACAPATTATRSAGPETEGNILAHRDPIVRSQMRERALDRLLTATASDYAQERANALEGLLSAPSRLGPVAAVGLDDPNEGVRSVAAMVAGRAGLKDLAPALRALRDDPSPFVVASSLYALAAMGDDADLSPIGSYLFDAESTRVRAHAAFALGEIGDPAALAMLSDAAHSRSPGAGVVEQKLLELQIAEAMVKLGDRSQLDSIRAALLPASPTDLEATALAVQIIGSVNDRASVDRLIYLSQYRDQRGNQMPAEVLLAIAGSLGKLGEHGGSFLADRFVSSPDEVIRAQAASAYGQIGRMEDLGKLATLAEDESPLVQVAASASILAILDGAARSSR
jgi:HEAT repeat protein